MIIVSSFDIICRKGRVGVLKRKIVLLIEVKSGKHYERHRALTHIMEVEDYGLDEALVFTDDSVNRKGKVRYLPVYQVMFLEKDVLPETMVYELPPLS